MIAQNRQHFETPQGGTQSPVPTIDQFFHQTLRTARWLVPLAVGLALLAGSAWLSIQAPKYTATMVVAPTRDSNATSGANLSRLRDVGSLVGISLPESGGVTPFNRFIETLTSVRLARELASDDAILKEIFAHQWAQAEKKWVPPRGLVPRIRRTIFEIFGLKSWSPPSEVSLAEFLRERLRVSSDGQTGIHRVRFEWRSPEFAVALLERLHDEADLIIREEARLRASRQIAYIESQLQRVTIMEYQEVLTELLSSQEKSMMMLNADLPYAASLIDPPTASAIPTSPNPVTTFAICLVLGIFAGIFCAVLYAAVKVR